MINKQTEDKHGKDGSMVTRHSRKKIKNMNLKKYLPLIGCWVVVVLLMGWFVSNDLVSTKQAIDHQCEQVEQVKSDMHRWHTLANNQLFPQ